MQKQQQSQMYSVFLFHQFSCELVEMRNDDKKRHNEDAFKFVCQINQSESSFHWIYGIRVPSRIIVVSRMAVFISFFCPYLIS